MKIVSLASIVALGLVGAIVMVTAGAGRDAQTPIYSLAQMDAKLARWPERWIGQTVKIRAIAEPCSLWGSPHSSFHCMALQPGLVDSEESLADPLHLTWRQPDPLRAFLRGIPLLADLLPAPQALQWGALATYRVRIRAASAAICGYSPCYEALLLDAAPDSP